MNKYEIIVEKNSPRVKKGSVAVSQADIDSILSAELSGIVFSGPIIIDKGIYDNGRTTAKQDPISGRIYDIKILIGKQRNANRIELIDTLVHEELEARFLKRVYNGKVAKDIALKKSGDKAIHDYINHSIKKFFELKGVE